jgi:hypothetical protein
MEALKEALVDDGRMKAVFSADDRRNLVFISSALEALLDMGDDHTFERLNSHLLPFSINDRSLAEMMEQACQDHLSTSNLSLKGTEMNASTLPIANVYGIITHLLFTMKPALLFTTEPASTASIVHIKRCPLLAPGRLRQIRNLPDPCVFDRSQSTAGSKPEDSDAKVSYREAENEIGISNISALHSRPSSSSGLQDTARPSSRGLGSDAGSIVLPHFAASVSLQTSASRTNQVTGDAHALRRSFAVSSEPTSLYLHRATRRSPSESPQRPLVPRLHTEAILPSLPPRRDMSATKAPCRRAESTPGLASIPDGGLASDRDQGHGPRPPSRPGRRLTRVPAALPGPLELPPDGASLPIIARHPKHPGPPKPSCRRPRLRLRDPRQL